MPDHELRDRLDIEEAIRRYATGLDERRWDHWDLAFTAAGIIDFTAMGGKRETRDEMRERLSRPDPDWLFAQHPVVNTVITLAGDHATAFSHFQMETGRRSGSEGEIIRTSGGGAYEDELVRTEAGWRIAERRVSLRWKETRRVRDEITRD
ncbi:nuclear transport factor 2 family protein [Aeromicrobium sp. YIM 150415]|uniref:nuclear transport factor 2 family protein n=1 Tax=Aeromicrobium sp. YIM 150415 TaxID=2803912 RepID=UPI0019660852|nr:nuclear transport factor 2 family protein [Aeromicrobium sp. YIM 150415]MBM9464094.1 nuclear transport factor 2 family protein [Aeromicrobium sp. YIM 150415]